MNVKDTIRLLKSEKASALMAELYGREGAAENETRYEKVLTGFEQTFSDRENILLFSSPGRTEISGNHTDLAIKGSTWKGENILAGSINHGLTMEKWGINLTAYNYSNLVHIISETYDQDITIDVNQLEPSAKKAGTTDLIKGLLKGFKEAGYSIGGFDAYVTSNVISAAGVSSSASFEMLLCSMLNTFFNEGRMDSVAYAYIGKYSENIYWDKVSDF